ncbi:MAG: triose-phosphate isomerase [Candidatus Aminicenantales bacterium]
MKTRPFVAGNWKMNLTVPETRAWIEEWLLHAAGLDEAETVVCPPFTALKEASRRLAGTGILLGAQNLHWEDKGAFTGEVSGPMLADAGCRYVIIGHSERRQLFGETDATVQKRIAAALRAGLRPIFCIGETLAQREAGLTLDIIGAQLEGGLAGLPPETVEGLIFAYEPVWAIGTGRTATPDGAQEVHQAIRERLGQRIGKPAAAYVIILYGGSVKPANAYALFQKRDIDGFLVGGASLEAASMAEIVRESIRAYKEVN